MAFFGMLDGCGGAEREFPSRFVWSRLIWARSPVCGWIWARSAGPKLRGEVVACIGLGALNVRGGGGEGDVFLTILFSVGLVSVRAILRISAA